MIFSLDIGSTVVKGSFTSIDGNKKYYASRRLEKSFSPHEWIFVLKEITAELTAKSAEKPSVIAVSGNGPTLVAADKNGELLEPVISWLDRRASGQAEYLSEVLLEYNFDASFLLPKALWLKENMPDVYKNTRFFLSAPESVVFRLTGSAVTVVTGRTFSSYFWDENVFSKIDIDKDKFPRFVSPGTIAGKVSKTASEESGLPRGIPVIASGADFIITLLGSGAVFPGRACDRSGTSEGFNYCSEKLISDRRLMCYEHIIKPCYNISGIISTTGKAFDWVKSVLGFTDTGYAALDKQIEKTSFGAKNLIFLPYLAGERAPLWNPDAKGVFFGLTLDHGRLEMARSVLESAGFALRHVIETIEENGFEINNFRITGGPSRSPLWNQIKADITGKRVLVPKDRESELTGSYLLALYALGHIDNLQDSADRFIQMERVYEPDLKKRALYEDLFMKYREIYRKLKELM